jgi:hypothetical protein
MCRLCFSLSTSRDKSDASVVSASSSLNLCTSLMWRRKAADDTPLDKLKDYKDDLKERLKHWTCSTYGYFFEEGSPIEACIISETKPNQSNSCGPIDVGVNRLVSIKRSYSLGTSRRLSRVYPMDVWKKRRMLKVGHVPYRDDPKDTILERNPVLYFDQ